MFNGMFNGTKNFAKSSMSILKRAARPTGGGGALGFMAMGAVGAGVRKGFNTFSIYGQNTSGMTAYGKRGIDANNLSTNGLVQGLSNKRRGR